MSCTKKICDESSPACSNALGIFRVQPTNIAVHQASSRETNPLAAVDQTSPYEFAVRSDSLWLDLSKTFLFTDLSLEKHTSTGWVPVEKADKVGVIQSIGQSFIRQLKVSINNTEIYDSGNLFPYKNYITNELMLSEAAKDSWLQAIGYRKDDADQDSLTNKGFLKRSALFAEGKRSQFIAPLEFDLSNQDLYLLNGTDLLFTIYRADDEFLILAPDPADNKKYRVKVHAVKIIVRMVDLQPSLNVTIASMLERTPAKYSLRKTEMRSCYISEGRTEIDFQAFTNILPRRMFACLIANEAARGSTKKSPFKTTNCKLREAIVYAGGLIFPSIPYNIDYDRGLGYVKAFVDLYDALGQLHTNRTCGITLEKFVEGWNFLAFQMTASLEDSGGFELVRNGTTSLKLVFSEPIQAGGVMLFLLGEFDQVLTIDKHRVVQTDTAV